MMRAWRNSLMSRQVRFEETFAIADPTVVWVATAVVVMAMLCSASGVVVADQPPKANRGAAEQGSEPAATYGDDRFRFGRSVRSLGFSPDGKEACQPRPPLGAGPLGRSNGEVDPTISFGNGPFRSFPPSLFFAGR